MYLEKVHLIGAKDEVALSMKGGMLSYAVLIATFVVCLLKNKYVLDNFPTPGDFVIVDPIEEGNKVCAEIVHILYSKQIKYLKNEGLW